MCGVAGLISENKMEYSSILHNMVDSIKYRGPDDTGYYMDDYIGLGHNRLSIIDPENGRQPAANEDESVVVIFNGEIFNFKTLRYDLQDKGHFLKNNSDTAILPHMYEEYGLDMFEKLNGQFAVVIWDKKKKKLILARDRFGEKPLFYFHKDKTFCFASEAKAILKSGLVQAGISPIALKQVFTFWTTLSDRSIFQGIYQVPPGSFLVYENCKKDVKPYWNYSYSKGTDIRYKDKNDLISELDIKLTASVKNRMISDVPISFYLSGGLDSSLIAAIAAGISRKSLNTFSITFDDNEFDESEYQDYMSQYLGTKHQRVTFSKKQIPSIIKDVIYHTEVPLLRSGAFPMYVLAGLVRNNDIKVVLSGEGSDELFGGYDIFREVKIREFCSRNPESKFRQVLYKQVNNYVKGLTSQSASSLSLYYNSPDLQSCFSSHLSRWKLGSYSQQFFSPEYREAMKMNNDMRELEDSLPRDFMEWTPVQRTQYLEIIILFTNYLLSSQGDRVSMAASVECRYPFLDYEAAKFAASIPDFMKIRGLNEKYIVKKMASMYVPDLIIKRRKFPYRAPINISELMKDEYVRHITSDNSLKQFGVFNPNAAERFISSALLKESPTERDCMLFMGILTTQILCEQFIKY
ncbi:MAG: asparagine synthase (glutamine-hydrolyzing) [Bacillota bacterium]|nr:asparagine synthase (glutamine-hydrolyzing) [Bacillota bacterium]